MKSLKTRLLKSREYFGLPWEVLERDYLLSWILAGIARTGVLNQTLVFKGGTALKKCYFGEYRFSEDLDFTAINSSVTENDLELAMQEACNQAMQLLDTYVAIEIVCQRHVEHKPHPRGQLAFDIHAKFPWHRQPQVNIMVEITRDEKIIFLLFLLSILPLFLNLFYYIYFRYNKWKCLPFIINSVPCC